MGIYPSNNIFGIRICNLDDDDFVNILFEETYDEIMSYTQMREAYLFYLSNNKKEISFQYYTKCSNTYRKGTYYTWQPMSLKLFLDKFAV